MSRKAPRWQDGFVQLFDNVIPTWQSRNRRRGRVKKQPLTGNTLKLEILESRWLPSTSPFFFNSFPTPTQPKSLRNASSAGPKLSSLPAKRSRFRCSCPAID